MAQIILENTREHDITLSGMDKTGNLVNVTVPGMRPHPVEEGKTVNGVAEADEEFVNVTKKSSDPVKFYFEQGWLKVVKSSEAAKA